MKSLLEGRLSVTIGDITRMKVDVIVNAANSSLMGGGGVDGAIHRAGGPAIIEECRKLRSSRFPGGLPTGQAVETGAGLLPARWVIHTVGPVWHGGGHGEEQNLADCYRNSLERAEHLGAQSIAFPAISTGIYGFPREKAAQVVWAAISDFVQRHAQPSAITLVFFGADDERVFLENVPSHG
ncbi:MAG TPA: O-acetyl-ADP-ribose deacetylase [Spirochaetia bacterium]|nr:O-acetyl-ADP-ribose deacetylase [Spirochaetia bacterium]